jgi:hypothetical protein
MTLYIIVNLAGISAISGLFGAVFYEHDRKKSDKFVILSTVSTMVILISPFILNIVDVMLKK